MITKFDKNIRYQDNTFSVKLEGSYATGEVA